jgi:hypothetical protein
VSALGLEILHGMARWISYRLSFAIPSQPDRIARPFPQPHGCSHLVARSLCCTTHCTNLDSTSYRGTRQFILDRPQASSSGRAVELDPPIHFLLRYVVGQYVADRAVNMKGGRGGGGRELSALGVAMRGFGERSPILPNLERLKLRIWCEG